MSTYFPVSVSNANPAAGYAKIAEISGIPQHLISGAVLEGDYTGNSVKVEVRSIGLSAEQTVEILSAFTGANVTVE